MSRCSAPWRAEQVAPQGDRLDERPNLFARLELELLRGARRDARQQRRGSPDVEFDQHRTPDVGRHRYHAGRNHVAHREPGWTRGREEHVALEEEDVTKEQIVKQKRG